MRTEKIVFTAQVGSETVTIGINDLDSFIHAEPNTRISFEDQDGNQGFAFKRDLKNIRLSEL